MLTAALAALALAAAPAEPGKAAPAPEKPAAAPQAAPGEKGSLPAKPAEKAPAAEAKPPAPEAAKPADAKPPAPEAARPADAPMPEGELTAVKAATIPELRQMSARFAPTAITADLSGLPESERAVLARLVEAAKVLDDLYMKQLWSKNLETYAALREAKGELAKAQLSYYWLNKGPWSELDDFKAFLEGVPARKYPGANYYPPDMSAAEFEKWVASLPKAEQEKAKGFFTVIRRGPGGKLAAIPYSKEYADELGRASKLLDEAAGLTQNASLAKFLRLRAKAFLTNDYYESDVAWMDLDADVDPTIGPYETYGDELFGYKAAFEAYIAVRDAKESARLEKLTAHLQEIEDAIPVEAIYRNPKVGAAAPIRVVNQVYVAGDGAHGVQAAAYNLPNDERVVMEKGSKRVMLKNVQQAKFDKVLVPISARVLTFEERKYVRFDSFFLHILAHELSHGLGLHQILVGVRETTPRDELKDLYGAIEEARADALGLFALQYLADDSHRLGVRDLITEADLHALYTTFLASSFRTLRFGLNEAHGKSTAVQLNWLLDRKAVVVRPDGLFAVDEAKMKDAVRELVRELATIEVTGDRARAQKLLDELGVLRPPVEKALKKLSGIPTDIAPVHVTAEGLLAAPAK